MKILKKILVLKGHSQYDVLRIATDKVSEELIRRGFDVTTIDLIENNDITDLNNNIIDNSYDMIFSFNGIALNAMSEEGKYIFDNFKMPIIAFLVDHPIYQQGRLNINCKNLNIATFDRENARFIKKYYPKIKNAEFIPFMGFEAAYIIPYEQRQFDVLFVGTYENPENSFQLIKDIPGIFQELAIKVIEILKNNTALSLEQGIRRYLLEINVIVSDDEFYDINHMMIPVDGFIRNYFRDKVVREVLDAGMKLHVYGNGWEVLKEEYNNLEILNNGEVKLLSGIELMANAKIVLSVMPWFKDCIQDRIISTMLNGAVSVTDSSIYMSENLRDREEIVYYSLDEIEKLPQILKEILKDKNKSYQIADNGRRIANERYTCSHFVENIIDMANRAL